MQWENTNNEEVPARGQAKIWMNYLATRAMNYSHPR